MDEREKAKGGEVWGGGPRGEGCMGEGEYLGTMLGEWEKRRANQLSLTDKGEGNNGHSATSGPRKKKRRKTFVKSQAEKVKKEGTQAE